MGIFFFILAVVFLILWIKEVKKKKSAEATNNELTTHLQSTTSQRNQLKTDLSAAEERIAALSKYEGLVEVDAEIEKKKVQATEKFRKQNGSQQIKLKKIKLQRTLLSR